MATVVFDLDGTLADTSGDLIAAANTIFAERGLACRLDTDRDAAVAFRGGRAMLRLGFERAGFPAEAVTQAVEDSYAPFLARYAQAIDTHTRLYPGAMAAVGRLSAAGYGVAVCTNKPSALAETLLERLGVREAFASLVGADTLPVRKPDPAPYRAAVERAGGTPARSVLIGDTETDLLTARAAGVPSILVGFGPAGATVAALGPAAVLDHYDRLEAVLDPLLPAPR